MTNNDSLLNAKNIPEFLEAINQKYGLDLPTDFSSNISSWELLSQLKEISNNSSIQIKTGEICQTEFPSLKDKKQTIYLAKGEAHQLKMKPFAIESENFQLKVSLLVTVFVINSS